MGLGKPPKVRELIRGLRAIGAKPVRVTGSHEIWETICGKRFPIVVNHPNDVCSRRVLQTIRESLGYIPAAV